MPHFAVQPLVYPVATSVHSSVLWWLYIHISAWGFGVARFDLQGHSQEPLTVERATVQGFTLEPKCGIYSFDNQIREYGNPMK